MCSSHTTSSKKHRKLRFSMLFCCKNAANVVGQGVGQTLTHTLTHTRKCPDGFEEYRRGSFCLLSGISHPFSAYITCAMKLPIVCAAFVLLLPRSVGVGAECESSVIVAEHTADGFDVHAILQCQRCEGMSEIMKSDVRQSQRPSGSSCADLRRSLGSTSRRLPARGTCQGFSGCLPCSAISRSTASCGMD